MTNLKASENVRFNFVAAVSLISISLWSCKLIDEGIFRQLEVLSCLLLILCVLFNTKVFLQKGVHFKVFVLCFLFLPLTSVIGAYLFHRQPIGLTLLLERVNLFWLLYFVLHIFDLPTERIKNLIIFLGGVWAFLTVAQQFTYPTAFFYSRGEDIRAGVIRLMVTGLPFGVFVLFYYFNEYLITRKTNYLLFAFFMMAALYFNGSRQTLGAAIFCMLIAVFMLKGEEKWKYITTLVLMGLVVVLFLQPSFLAEHIELTTVQMNDEDYIRFRAVDFYFNEYWPHWGAKLIGNGKPHIDSDYGLEMEYLSKGLGLFRVDIGIIGAYNSFGLFYIVNAIIVTIKALSFRLPSEKNRPLKLYLIFSTILLPLSFFYPSAVGMSFFSLLFYLIDKAVTEKKGKEIGISRPVTKKYLTTVV